MQSAPASKRKYRFGLFEADLGSGALLRQGARVRLQDQPFRLLIILLERSGDVVSREELRQKLWPANTYVEFDGSLNAALKRLRAALADPADNPIFIETIPKRGYRFLAPVTILDEPTIPAPAPFVAQVVASAVETPVPSPTEASAIKPANPTTKAGPAIKYAGLIAAVLLITTAAWYGLRHFPKKATASALHATAPLPPRKSIAILGFHNASGRTEDQWLATAFSEMLSTELASGEKLRLIPGEEISNLQLSAPWSLSGTLGPDTTARLGSALNSDLLVSGSYTSVGSADRRRLRLDVRLQDARTGNVLTQIAETSSSDDLFRITSEIGTKLRERMGIPAIGNTEEAGVLASLPLNRDAARFYALGIAKLREFDALAAKDLLEQACAADPKFSLAHAMLARAWAELGYEQKRKQEAKKALNLSIDLPRVDRLQVEGDYYSSLPDFEKAASTYRALFELFPDSVEYGLQLAYTQNSATHPTQALETIARLRQLSSPASLDPSIDLAEAKIEMGKPDGFPLLEAALKKPSTQGNKLLYANIRLEQCHQLVYSDHPQPALSMCEDAYNAYQAAGNKLGAARALTLIADYHGGNGNYAEAKTTYEHALKVLEGLGEHQKTGVILNNMAIIFTNEGNLEHGEQLYRQALYHFQQAGDRNNVATALSNIADISYLRGNLAAAKQAYQQSIDIVGSIEGVSPTYPLYRMADVELTQGHVEEAHRLAAKAIDLMGNRADRHSAMAEMGDVLLAEDDLQGARRQYQSALDLRQTQGRTGDVAEMQLSLANVALEDGHPDQAERLLRPAIAEYEKEKEDPGAAGGYILLSRVALRQGKIDDAHKEIQHAGELIRSTPDPGLRLQFSIQNARVEAAGTSDSRQGISRARVQLHSAIDLAQKLGYHQAEFDARLVLCELEIKTNPVTGRSLSRTLGDQANALKLGLISQKAAALAASTDAVTASGK